LNTAKVEYDGKEIPVDFPGLEKYLQPEERFCWMMAGGNINKTDSRYPYFAEVVEGEVLTSIRV